MVEVITTKHHIFYTHHIPHYRVDPDGWSVEEMVWVWVALLELDTPWV